MAPASYRTRGHPRWPANRGIAALVGPFDAAVLEAVWSHSEGAEATANDVFNLLRQRNAVRYTSVVAALGRLRRQGLLRAERGASGYRYTATATPDELVTAFLRQVRRAIPLRSGARAQVQPEADFLSARAKELADAVRSRQAPNDGNSAG